MRGSLDVPSGLKVPKRSFFFLCGRKSDKIEIDT